MNRCFGTIFGVFPADSNEYRCSQNKAALEGEGLALKTAGGMIENVIGTFKMPMGVSVNMTVNGKE